MNKERNRRVERKIERNKESQSAREREKELDLSILKPTMRYVTPGKKFFVCDKLAKCLKTGLVIKFYSFFKQEYLFEISTAYPWLYLFILVSFS